MSEPLKPCPFCGVVPELQHWGHWSIECASDRCPASIASVINTEAAEAVAQWNTRVEAKAAELTDEEAREALGKIVRAGSFLDGGWMATVGYNIDDAEYELAELGLALTRKATP